MQTDTVHFEGVFHLETGEQLHNITISYHTYGVLSPQSKVVWICHALTANSNPKEWWPGMVGVDKCYKPDDYFIICANFIGSCYGSTGPLSADENGVPYFANFPRISIRDMVRAHDLLRQYLKIDAIYTLIGSSVGGFQALEMAIICNCPIQHLIILASNARVSPWSTALNEAQRMAIFADKSYYTNTPHGGADGLCAARAMALLSYRSYFGYNSTQAEADDNTLFAHRAVSYQQYQGKKLAQRFDAYSYVTITYAVDSHNVGRGRGGLNKALQMITAKTLLIGIDSDLLFPPSELQQMESMIPNAQYTEISSSFGHDGFLLESEQITELIQQFYIARST